MEGQFCFCWKAELHSSCDLPTTEFIGRPIERSSFHDAQPPKPISGRNLHSDPLLFSQPPEAARTIPQYSSFLDDRLNTSVLSGCQKLYTGETSYKYDIQMLRGSEVNLDIW
nr:unnamed protein product [Haemonchus contortus]